VWSEFASAVDAGSVRRGRAGGGVAEANARGHHPTATQFSGRWRACRDVDGQAANLFGDGVNIRPAMQNAAAPGGVSFIVSARFMIMFAR